MNTRAKARLAAGVALLAALVVGGNFLAEKHLMLLNLVIVTVAFVGCVTFVLRYSVTTRGAWAHSAVGRNMMLLTGCLAVAMGFISSVYMFGEYPFRRSIGTGIYATIAYAAWQRVLLQFRAQSRLPAPIADNERRRRSTDRHTNSTEEVQ